MYYTITGIYVDTGPVVNSIQSSLPKNDESWVFPASAIHNVNLFPASATHCKYIPS